MVRQPIGRQSGVMIRRRQLIAAALVAALGGWLAERGATMDELRSGASLEDAYTAVVGELAFETAPERPASAGRRRSRR